LRSDFKRDPQIRKNHLPGWSAGMHSLFDEIQSLFRVVNPETGSGFCQKK
jgi:hypothetical protein